MQDPILIDLLSYWERLRAGRIAPTRADVDPREISGNLEHTFVLEYNSPGDIRFRLAGMRLCELMGMELRGMPARSLIDPSARLRFDAILHDVVAEPKVVELQLSNPGARSNARMLLLPMQNDIGEITRILGCLTTQGAAGAPPNRFTIMGNRTTRIVAGEQTRLPMAEQAPVAGFAEPTERFAHKDPTGDKPAADTPLKSERPYLRLVKDDD